MNFTNEGIKSTIQRYNELLERISSILELHKQVNGFSYNIIDIQFIDNSVCVDLDLLKEQKVKNISIDIDLELLTDDDVYEKFKNKRLNKINKKTS